MAIMRDIETESPVHARLTYLVKQLERAIRISMDEITRDFGLTTIQYTAISVLARNPGMSSAQLARRSFVSPQACSEIITVLEAKGWVKRTASSENRRMLHIEVTKLGRNVLRKCDQRMDEFEEIIFGVLKRSERQDFRDALIECVASVYPEIRPRLR